MNWLKRIFPNKNGEKAKDIWNTFVQVFHSDDDELKTAHTKYLSLQAKELIATMANFFFEDFMERGSVRNEIITLQKKTIDFLRNYLVIQMVEAYWLKIARAVVEKDILEVKKVDKQVLTTLVNATYVPFMEGKNKPLPALDGGLLIMHNKIGINYIQSQLQNIPRHLLQEYEGLLTRAKIFSFITFESERALTKVKNKYEK